ncbi:MAG: hypothetical protein COA99_16610 [Moraxellaceae bacterium]|nr:MAG: hypothetical protein COA99_16610 [Moraxellaceae bacterium]
MTTEQTLLARCDSKCELCASTDPLAIYEVPPVSDASAEQCVMLCTTCKDQIEGKTPLEANHWRCLNDSVWTPEPAVQVMAWRTLKQLSAEGWASDLLDMLYLEDDVQQWAESGADADSESDVSCVDSNGAQLQKGDTVTLIKDLVVKGANFTAKRGTTVKNISLTDNPEHIEGRVNSTRIVLLTCFLKKAN